MTSLVQFDRDCVSTIADAVRVVLRVMEELSDEEWNRITIAEIDSSVWLRSTGDDADMLAKMRFLPGVVFRCSSGNLFRPDHSVPEQMSPETEATVWLPVRELCRVELPVPRIAPRNDAVPRTKLRLIRGGTPMNPTGLLCDLSDLVRWVETAPQIRLDRLRWVWQTETRQCLVLGDPLPPIAGTFFVATNRVLVPAGWTWSPGVTADVVREVFAVPDKSWLLWESDVRWCVIEDQVFSNMSRGGVRRATESPAHACGT